MYYQIDEATENEVIIPLADIMISNNYEVKPVLSALFKSEHFFDLQHQACFIKNPFDIIVGTLREFGAAIPASTDWQNGYAFLIPYMIMPPICSRYYSSHRMYPVGHLLPGTHVL